MIGSICQLQERHSIRARRLRASLLPHTTCVSSCCTWRATLCGGKTPKKNESQMTLPDEDEPEERIA